MKINKNLQTQGKFKYTSEPISEETRKEFPDTLLEGHRYGSPTFNAGYERPIKDQVYIENRSKELEDQLKTIREKMETLKLQEDIGTKVALTGAAVMLAPVGIAGISLIGGVIPLSPALLLGGVIGGGIAYVTGNVLADSAGHKMHGNWIQYYNDRTELDHLKRGEQWVPMPESYKGED